MVRRARKKGREAIRSLRALDKFQREQDARLRQYRVSRKPDISIPIRKMLELRASSDLNSVNLISRIQVGICLSEKLRSNFQVHGIEDAYFVTLISEMHGVRAGDRNGHDVAAQKAWIALILAGFSYVGMIEPAYYPVVSFMPPGNEDWISWHAHIVVWNTKAATLKDLKEIVNGSEDSFRPGGVVFHYRKAPARRIEAEVAYMCKSPRSEHYTYPVKRVIIDPTTRKRTSIPTESFKQNKRQLRTGKLLIVLSALEDKPIEDLCVSGGSGCDIAADALLAAKRVLEEEQRARDAAIRSL